MEEPALLITGQRITGGIGIEDDLARRLAVRLEEEPHEQRLDGGRLVADLVVARGNRAGEFEPVERRLAGNRRTIFAARRKLARQYRHQRLVGQLVVVVEVFVAERDGKDALADQRSHAVLDEFRYPLVIEAAGEALDETHGSIRRSQQQSAPIRRNGAAVAL